MRSDCGYLILILVIGATGAADNLIQNPGAEMGPTLPYWTKSNPKLWNDTDPGNGPHSGIGMFFPGRKNWCSPECYQAFLTQEINLTDYSDSTVTYNFSGWGVNGRTDGLDYVYQAIEFWNKTSLVKSTILANSTGSMVFTFKQINITVPPGVIRAIVTIGSYMEDTATKTGIDGDSDDLSLVVMATIPQPQPQIPPPQPQPQPEPQPPPQSNCIPYSSYASETITTNNTNNWCGGNFTNLNVTTTQFIQSFVGAINATSIQLTTATLTIEGSLDVSDTIILSNSSVINISGCASFNNGTLFVNYSDGYNDQKNSSDNSITVISYGCISSQFKHVILQNFPDEKCTAWTTKYNSKSLQIIKYDTCDNTQLIIIISSSVVGGILLCIFIIVLTIAKNPKLRKAVFPYGKEKTDTY